MFSRPKSSEEILEICLNRIQKGQDTAQTVLERFPEQEANLRPALEAYEWLEARRGVFMERANFLPQSRRRLLIRLQQAPLRRPGFPNGGRLRIQFAIGLLLVLALVFSTFGMALASSESLPGDNLYAVKLILEDAQLLLTPGLQADTELEIQFAQRRLNEIHTLALEGRFQDISTGVRYFETDLGQAVSSWKNLSQIDPNQGQEVAQSLQLQFADQAVKMAALREVVPTSSQEDLNELVQAATLVAQEAQKALQSEEPPTPLPTSTVDQPEPSPTLAPTASSLPPQPKITELPVVLPPTPARNSLSTQPAPEPTLQDGEKTKEPKATKEPKPTKEPKATKEPKPTKEPKANDPKPKDPKPKDPKPKDPPGQENKPPKPPKPK